MLEYILFIEVITLAVSVCCFALNDYDAEMFTYTGIKTYTEMNMFGIILLLTFYIIFAHWVYIGMLIYLLCHVKIK